jgi:uncharacterized membrane protein YtjA (UPF0391 family)
LVHAEDEAQKQECVSPKLAVNFFTGQEVKCLRPWMQNLWQVGLTTERSNFMIRYALIALIIAIIAGLLGFTGIAGAATNIAWVLFVLGLIVALIFFLKKNV